MDLRKRWTIYDIAREAGVSAKTVSRVINGMGGVGAETRAHIMEIIERVDYRPYIAARTLRGKRSACIGITLSTPVDTIPISQGFLIWIFEQIYRTFGVRGEYVCFDLNPFAQDGWATYARGVLESLFKACIVAGPLTSNDTVIDRIHESGVPYLVLSRLDRLPDLSSATVDYEEGAYMSTKFLLERGHRRIAMLKGFEGFQPGIERRRGYVRALEEAGIAVDDSLIRSAGFNARNIANFVHRLLADSSVTALIDCSATEDGTSLREGIRRAGRRPGEDVEIVAWTYMENTAILDEAVAHVWLPVWEAASVGLEELAQWTNGQLAGPIKVLYKPSLHTSWAGSEIRPRRLFDLLD